MEYTISSEDARNTLHTKKKHKSGSKEQEQVSKIKNKAMTSVFPFPLNSVRLLPIKKVLSVKTKFSSDFLEDSYSLELKFTKGFYSWKYVFVFLNLYNGFS